MDRIKSNINSDNSLRYCWISFPYREHENAEAWAKYLSDNCVWDLSCFGAKYAWDAPIPHYCDFAQELAEFNEHLRLISSYR